MVKIKDLTKAEQEAIGYKSEQGLQSVSTSQKNDDKGVGTTGTFSIIVVASALLVAGVVVMKKRLSKKVV